VKQEFLITKTTLITTGNLRISGCLAELEAVAKSSSGTDEKI
jgi:hypothetical protein